jgi:hypothetical protein
LSHPLPLLPPWLALLLPRHLYQLHTLPSLPLPKVLLRLTPLLCP